MSWTHFEEMAAEYATARPPYPQVLFDALAGAGVIGHGLQVLEIGAGSGLATAELVRRGCAVVALEPGTELATLLHRAVPAAEVVVTRLEDAELPAGAFDSVVAATSLHWVDLGIGLPLLHRALRAGGMLAVFRNVFGDDSVPQTPFRARIAAIVARRPGAAEEPSRDRRPTIAELTADGLFEELQSKSWTWSMALSADRIRRLFATFSNWTADEVAAAGHAADELGGRVEEHYRTELTVLRRSV